MKILFKIIGLDSDKRRCFGMDRAQVSYILP